MIVYHGTTRRRAQRICTEGFLPRKPSRRVWFAQGRGYALGRAKTQARRSHDRPVVLTCDVNVADLRRRLGPKKVMHRNGVIAIDAPLPVTVLRSHPGVEFSSTPKDLASWVNHLLGLKPYKGVPATHPGLERLSRWVTNRQTSQPHSRLRPVEVCHMARQWLPEFFEGVEVDPDTLRVLRRIGGVEVEVAPPEADADPREEEALDCLTDPKPRRRVRGLSLLGAVAEPDELSDWCTMFLDDESVNVRVAALQAMLVCDDAEPDVIEPLARSDNKRVRAAAIAALAKHAGPDAPRWFERGLKDPCACVRLATARQLPALDPTAHRALFELALYDPNPQVARTARKLCAGKGYAKCAYCSAGHLKEIT